MIGRIGDGLRVASRPPVRQSGVATHVGQRPPRAFRRVPELRGTVLSRLRSRPQLKLLLCSSTLAGPNIIKSGNRHRVFDSIIPAVTLLFRANILIVNSIHCCVSIHVLASGAARGVKGGMPPSIGHMELLVWLQRADFSEHIHGRKSPGDTLNSSHFDAPNTKSAPTGYRRAPNIISHHYKQQLSAKASIVPKARPIRFRY